MVAVALDADMALRLSRPCPFHGGGDDADHELQILFDVAKGWHRIHCRCGARGPYSNTPQHAVERWNVRLADAAQAKIEQSVGRLLVNAQKRVDDVEKKFADMQVANNALLERARAAEAKVA
jgi:uncharacterized protein YbcV (DUF1398 family)